MEKNNHSQLVDAHELEEAIEEVEHDTHSLKTIFKQPKAAWAVAFACVIAFMGIGLVDPILPSIASHLNATNSQVELLFTSYMAVTGIVMLFTGWISSRIGPKLTLLLGLAVIVVFSAFGGTSDTVAQLVGYRAGWGLGNALFISTALSVIVSVASGGAASAIVLYEAALGLGMSVGPLLGGILGGINWRGPFFGVATLMIVAFIGVFVLLSKIDKPKKRTSILDPIKALSHGGLLSIAIMALFYNFGFFTLLAYSPLVLDLDAHGIGFVFFFWGVLLAICSVIVAPKLEKKLGTQKSVYLMMVCVAIILVIMGIFTKNQPVVIVCIAIMGAFLGINNTLVTTAVMEVAPIERSVASSAYSFVRFGGGAVAPWLAGKLSEAYNPSVPFFFSGFCVLIGLLVFILGKRKMTNLT